MGIMFFFQNTLLKNQTTFVLLLVYLFFTSSNFTKEIQDCSNTFIMQCFFSKRKIKEDFSVRFFGFANGSQSEHDISNESPKKTRQIKRSINEKNKKFLKSLTGKEFIIN